MTVQLVLLKIVFLLVTAFSISSAGADTWRGTAPFCSGKCLPGETQIAKGKCGDGACCWTGQKVLCKNSNPTCQASQTQTSCYGVLMMCDNGHFVGGNPPVWVSCAKYACGMCFGFW